MFRIPPLMLLAALTASASTNVLQLTWLQPAGWESHLYSSTSLNGEWSSFGLVNPPVDVTPTNPVTFFYVSVSPVQSDAVLYSVEPNSESIKPFPTNSPAFAYSLNSGLPIYFWNPTTQLWQ